MENEDLRKRLQRLDPSNSGELRSMEDRSTRQMLENIMNTPVSSATNPGRPWYLAAAAAVVLFLGAFFGFQGTTNDQPPLQLSLGQSDALASCLALSVDVLAEMPIAFEGTATEVDGETVTLKVDRWFAGGEASSVELHAPAGMQALIGGIDFAVGTQYLITASEGSVNYCGYSDVATPELRALFEEAFAG